MKMSSERNSTKADQIHKKKVREKEKEREKQKKMAVQIKTQSGNRMKSRKSARKAGSFFWTAHSRYVILLERDLGV